MRILLLNQTFWPDVMATGQYLAEVATALTGEGHDVTVVTSRRAYDDPTKTFPAKETWRGVRIIRIGSTAFGKGAKWRRAADFGSFMALCALRVLFMRRHDVVVALTTPPLIAALGALLSKMRGNRFVYWVMDFNPDEAIAAGWLRAGSLAARILESISRFSLRNAACIIALDRFMRDRILAKGIPSERIAVIPPWSHDEDVRFDPEARTRFRQKQGLQDKFVVMYSGNHSPVHPLQTLLEAAGVEADAEDGRSKIEDRPPSAVSDPISNLPSPISHTLFAFIGGGSEWRRISETVRRLGCETVSPSSAQATEGRRPGGESVNESLREAPRGLSTLNPQLSTTPPVLCLPYQPLAELSGSLSAADLQVVAMGNHMLGLVHPCKIYNLLAIAAPILYIGPRPSHITEILERLPKDYPWWHANHSDPEAVRRAIHEAQSRLQTGRQIPVVLAQFSQATLLPQLLGAITGIEAGPRALQATCDTKHR